VHVLVSLAAVVFVMNVSVIQGWQSLFCVVVATRLLYLPTGQFLQALHVLVSSAAVVFVMNVSVRQG